MSRSVGRPIADVMDPFRPDPAPGQDPEKKHPKARPKGAGPIKPGRARTAGAPPSPAVDSAAAADRATDRLAVFAHELASLVDGTMRYVLLARAGLSGAAANATAGAADDQLQAAVNALERMAGLIHAAMRPGSGSLADQFHAGRSLRDAIDHAVEALRPLADHRGVRVSVRCGEAVGHAHAGPLFTVVSNALRNAIEACGPGGSVDLSAVIAPARTSAEHKAGDGELTLDVTDDGVGPPEGAGNKVFNPGFTSKPGSAGLGLALCREIVEQLGGTIDLTARMDGKRRGGAHLRVRCPVSLQR